MDLKALELVHFKISDIFATYKKIFVAYSGGLDSHVLLHLLAGSKKRIKSSAKLTAIHINHNLSCQAQAWEHHCRQICRKMRVNYVTKKINAKMTLNSNVHKQSPEEILRQLRYAAIAKILPKNSCLLTAHHANDQAETLLLQLFRGAGPKGLAAMPEKAQFAGSWLVRPLLNFTREDLLQYAQKHKLTWVEDESNVDSKYDRNFIRHKVIPIIKTKWPSIVVTLNRAARNSAEASELLAILAAQDLAAVTVTRGENKNNDVIDVELLKKINFMRQKNLVRWWLQKLNLTIPSELKMQQIMKTVVASRYDATPVIKWFGTEIRRFRQYIYAIPPLTPHDNTVIIPFHLRKKQLNLPGNLGTLKIQISPGFKFDFRKFTIRFRCGGEKIKLSQSRFTYDLKKLMQTWKIPPWLRDRIPLVYYGDEIVAVVGYCSNINGVKFEHVSM